MPETEIYKIDKYETPPPRTPFLKWERLCLAQGCNYVPYSHDSQLIYFLLCLFPMVDGGSTNPLLLLKRHKVGMWPDLELIE